MRFGIEVNTIPQGGTGEVNPNSIGIVVGMGPLIKKLFVCMVFCQAQFQLASLVLVELRLALLSLSDPPHSLRKPSHHIACATQTRTSILAVFYN